VFKKPFLILAIVSAALLYLTQQSHAQVTLAFQGGENGDNWGYTSSGADATATFEANQFPNIISGLRSIVVGGNTGGGSCIDGGSGNGPATQRTFTFDPVDISSSNLTARTLTFHWGNRFPICLGTGWDANENLIFTPILDGVPQPQQTLAIGGNDATFNIQTNQFSYSIPPCVNTFAFSIYVTTNRRDELLLLDDVRLSAPSLNETPEIDALLSGETIVCAGENSALTVTPISGASYTWNGIPTSATIIGSNTSNSIEIDWGNTNAGTYNITVSANISVCNQSISSVPFMIPIQILPTSSSSITAAICDGESYSIGTTNYTTSGNYQITLQNSNGCDSIVSLNLSVASSVINSIQATICANEEYTIGNQTFNSSGNYSVSLIGQNGCDSVVNLSLTVLPAYEEIIEEDVCAGENFFYEGNNYSSPGNYIFNYQTASGCDSIVELLLIAPNEDAVVIQEEICENESYSFAGTSHSAAGSYSGVYTSSLGCDSLVQLNLSINPTFEIDQNILLCGEEVYDYNGNIYQSEGTFPVLFESAKGCDSTVFLTITIEDQIINYLETSICTGEHYVVNGIAYDTTGVYEIVFENQNGCDSLLYLSLVVLDSPDASFVASLLNSTDEYDEYSFTSQNELNETTIWNFGDGSALSYDATVLHNFPNSSPEEFIVSLTVVNEYGCEDSTSQVITITPPLLLYIPNTFTPNGGKFNTTFDIVISGDFDPYAFELLIFNRWGEVVFESKNSNKSSWDGSYNGQPAQEGTYIWMLKLNRLSNGEEVIRRGHINLLR